MPAEKRVAWGIKMTNYLPKKLAEFNRAEEGQAVVMVALGLVVLLLMAGLGLDVGYLRYEKQQMQKAADAGAIAAASAKIYGGSYAVAGQNDAAANGFKDGVNGINVNVYNPPVTAGDPFQGNKGYVEVIVSQPQPTFFMRVGGFNSANVSSRAVASMYGNPGGCIYVLDPGDQDTYTATGTITLSSACGLLVDSANAKAFKDNGGACTDATSITIVGGVDVDACSQPQQAGIVTGAAPFSDPLSYLQPPQFNGCDYTNFPQINKNTTIQPGVYCGGIQVSGAGTQVTLASGLYVLNGGGFKMSGGGSLIGDPAGVMFYNTGNGSGVKKYGTIDIEGVNNTTLTASSVDTTTGSNAGMLAGILFFDDRNASSYINHAVNIITGGSSASIVGALYFPSTALQYSGGTRQSTYTVVVAYQLTINGNATFNDDYSDLPGGGSPIHAAVLAE